MFNSRHPKKENKQAWLLRCYKLNRQLPWVLSDERFVVTATGEGVGVGGGGSHRAKHRWSGGDGTNLVLWDWRRLQRS